MLNMYLKEKIKKLFIERLPNTLLSEHIKIEFPSIDPDKLESILKQLVRENFLDIKQYPHNRQGYATKGDFLQYPILFEMDIGSMKIPRMIDGDVARGEDINSIAIGLSRTFDQKISELKTTFDKEIKKYWASIATIFGLFISIFSMVNLAVKPIYFSEQLGLSPKQQFIQTLYNLGPLAGVMALFIFFLWLILRR